MRIRGFRVRQLLSITILSFLLAALPGTGKADQGKRAVPKEPEVFRQIKASVVSLKLYTTRTLKDIPMPTRVYKANFVKSDTPYIWWELCLKIQKPPRQGAQNMGVRAIWQLPDGTEFNQSVSFNIPANFQQPCLSGGWGGGRPGGWLPGTYRVVIQVDDVEVASTGFEMFHKIFKEK
jgi:hypothetical protein